jgi:hypothetical protein
MQTWQNTQADAANAGLARRNNNSNNNNVVAMKAHGTSCVSHSTFLYLQDPSTGRA